MRRSRTITACGSAALLAACLPVVACPTDPPPGTCCTDDFTLTTAPAHPLAHPRSGPLNGGPDTTQTVHVFNFEYSINPVGGPIEDATINVGDTIHWQWDSGAHSVTSVGGSVETYDSGILFPPDSFDYTFTQQGVFTYYCTLHGFDNGDGTAVGMAGTITVVPAVINSSWNVDFDGSWQTASNWTNNAIPNGAGHTAYFGPVISGPRGVLVDGPVTVGSINLNSPSPRNYMLGGSSTITLTGAGASAATVSVLDGSHTIVARLQPNSNTTFHVGPAASILTLANLQATTAALTKTGSGTLVLNNVRAAALTMDGGTVSVFPNGSDAGASRIGTLAVAGGPTAPTSTMDLNNNDLSATSTPIANVQALIVHARNGGVWDRPGLTSSAARTQPAHATTLGLLSGSEWISINGSGVPFDGFTVAGSDALVKYTWYGDADFNGEVNFDDYVRTDAGFNGGLSGWLNGDYDLNGAVDFDDYVLIDLGFNSQSGTLRAAVDWLSGDDRSFDMRSTPGTTKVLEHYQQFGLGYAQGFLAAVPEPAHAALLIACAIPLTRRRCRRG